MPCTHVQACMHTHGRTHSQDVSRLCGPSSQPAEGRGRGEPAGLPGSLLPAPGLPRAPGRLPPLLLQAHVSPVRCLPIPLPSIQVLHPLRASRWGPKQLHVAKLRGPLPCFPSSLCGSPPSGLSPGELQSRRPVSLTHAVTLSLPKATACCLEVTQGRAAEYAGSAGRPGSE